MAAVAAAAAAAAVNLVQLLGRMNFPSSETI